jgi:hypothetical protein
LSRRTDAHDTGLESPSAKILVASPCSIRTFGDAFS